MSKENLLSEEEIKDFIEKGAELEHIRWAKWQNYLHSYLSWNNDIQAWVLPHEKRERWQRQIETYYGALSEIEKESDRKEARNYLPLIAHLISSRELKAQQETLQEVLGEVEKIRINRGYVNDKYSKGYDDMFQETRSHLQSKLSKLKEV